MSNPAALEVLIRIDGRRDGRFNMTTDSDLLSRAEESVSPFTCVRFYGWKRPTVSLGRNQDPASALDEAFCRTHAIDWVHRPTGGRAVYHDREVTYAVVSNDDRLFPVGRISETYRVIGRILQTGLQRMGLETAMEKSGSIRSSKSSAPLPCFASSSRSELTWQGRKLIGSAQRVLKRSFLQHGSIPLHLDYRTAAQAVGCSPESLRAAATSLGEVLPPDSDLDDLQVEMAREFWKGLLEGRVQEAHRRRPSQP